MTTLNYLIEYMKLHLISLEQDIENFKTYAELNTIKGQVDLTRHYLSVATDILEEQLVEEGRS